MSTTGTTIGTGIIAIGNIVAGVITTDPAVS
jgi:hypothetical protein